MGTIFKRSHNYKIMTLAAYTVLNKVIDEISEQRHILKIGRNKHEQSDNYTGCKEEETFCQIRYH